MLSNALPAIPEPNFTVLTVVGAVIGTACILGALGVDYGTRLRKAAAVALGVLGVGVLVGTVAVGQVQRNAHRDEVRDAIEKHWEVTHLDGPVTSVRYGWVGEVGGVVKQCHTHNGGQLVVVCDGEEPAIRR